MPSVVVSLLLGIPFTDPGAILIGRLAGAALISIAVTCWLLRSEPQSFLMVKVMLGYNTFSITLLLYAALVEGIFGPGLWPACYFILYCWFGVYHPCGNISVVFLTFKKDEADIEPRLAIFNW
jgi:hypothetical protein